MCGPKSGSASDSVVHYGKPTGEELLRLLRERRENGERREQEQKKSFEQLEQKLFSAEPAKAAGAKKRTFEQLEQKPFLAEPASPRGPKSGSAADPKLVAKQCAIPTAEEMQRLLRERREHAERRDQEQRKSFDALEQKLILAEQRNRHGATMLARLETRSQPLQRQKTSEPPSPSRTSSASSESDESWTKLSARSTISTGASETSTKQKQQKRHWLP
mmetsp:Transcript_40121/g.71158  ORF Transcript_40121/g.71158 Transcript_40121/m.71158 type:complete len:218 (+) Transcript_40121:132-785(+)